MIAVVDNDVLHKALRYGLLEQILGHLGRNAGDSIGILGAARFVVGGLIERERPIRGNETLRRELDGLLTAATILEPTPSEQQLAADLEFAAQQHSIPLDAGESQLCAIVLERAIPKLLTGDKRAIAGMELLMSEVPRLQELSRRLWCLEQAILGLLDHIQPASVREAVCAEREVDKALAFCFSCFAVDFAVQHAVECLNSYINALRKDAPRVLAP